MEVITNYYPVMAGMPARAAVFVDGSPVFETGEGFQGSVLARYADADTPLPDPRTLGEAVTGIRDALRTRDAASVD